MKAAREQWNKTQLGQLVQDPAMKPFVEDVRRQLDERVTGTRLGLTIDDLREVPGGEVAIAAIQPAAGRDATAVIVDISGHQQQAQEMLKRVAATMAKQGAQQKQLESGGVTLIVYDLPPHQGQPAPATSQQAIYFIRENTLVAASDLEVIQGILAKLAGKTERSLADVPSFQAVMKRVQADAGKTAPHIRWYIQPIGYLEIAQAAQTERGEKRRRKRSMIDIFKKQGFGAIQGIGGFVNFSTGKFEIIHRTAAYAPKPYEGAMKMLVFPNGKDFKPEAWVPRDMASYTTFYADVPNAFDNFGSLFDEMYNEGESGLWKEVISGLADDPNGPRVKLREELIAFLGPRISVLTDYQLPITPTSERLLFAIETKEPKAVATALAKLFKNDKEMRRVEHGEYVIWEAKPPEKATVPPIDLKLPDIGGGPGPGARQPQAQAQGPSILPNQAMTVAFGHLMVASHIDFLTKVLKQGDERQSLARAVEYRVVDKAIEGLNPPAKAAQFFSRTDETYRPTYELIREGKMPQSETMFGRVLNTALATGKKGVPRKQAIEGGKMPEYDYVRRSLGPGGAFSVSEDQGWFFKGVLIGKQSQ